MQQNPPPPTPTLTPDYLPRIPEMPSDVPQTPSDDLTSSSLFDWSDFLDFNLDETLNSPDLTEQTGFDQSQSTGRVRKRDPMLVCPNFLAGVIPCACPELDKKLEEEESMLPGKKRARAVKGALGARCQVPGCEADISELKGYHKRHRVCLRCATATTVVVDGETKRYCQQCGKFHILSDFDEGKRSCRRKLERHNNRRRRKSNDPKGGMQKDSEQIILADDVSGDDDAGKGITFITLYGACSGRQNEEKEILLESEGQVSTPCSTLGQQNNKSDTYGEIHIDGEKQDPQLKCSPSYFDNKSTFSSVCPTGRISFKLYDWNPAEFPRRLRHQIFQWLASMPVELEGYIRPGCTILTVFVAMPKPMWLKLFEEPALHIKELVSSPGNMLFGRGTMHVHLNDMKFRVTKDATSVVKVKVKDRAPKLHYIYPTCFEAGRPMEFVACGSDLLKPKLRFLVSFAGRYLSYKICVSSLCCKKEYSNSFNHQLLSIYVPQTDMDLHGPAFIEIVLPLQVENQSGLSNFIPILLGDKETCAEMEILQQKFSTPISSQEQKTSDCDVLASRQTQISEFIHDVAWSLKKPVSNHQLTSSHVQRFNYLLTSLIEKESCVILERVFCSIKSAIDNKLVAGIPDSDMKLLQKNMDIAAQSMIHQKSLEKDLLVTHESHHSVVPYQVSKSNDLAYFITRFSWDFVWYLFSLCFMNEDLQDIQKTLKDIIMGLRPLVDEEEGARVPLLNREVVMNVVHQERPAGKPCGRFSTRMLLTSRPLIIMAIATIGVCFGVCAVVFHPQRVDQIATTIRSCLFNNS
ncbi:hypothetical protein RD792_010459 [Penstemon davidsonii]|uniref:SBP-type domain-containing protein n=1 Tax=Penstemon davidsonii TaxID=160366 RepID=A0ABR0D1Y8_9LAMI|nr:hypothetical protein RD792_010459 [Penstemon davidsonii]